MVDIFLSYDPSDLERAADLADVLEREGWSVWWYREGPRGPAYDTTTQEALAEARCVVVLWTRGSVDQRWVLEEALVGAGRGILVSVLLDDVEVPHRYRGFPTTRLVDWDGTATFHALFRLLDPVADIVRTGPPADATPWAAAFDRRSDDDVRTAVDTLMEAGLKAEMLDEVIASVFRHFPRSEREHDQRIGTEPRREPARVAARLGVLRRAVPDLLSSDKLDALAELPKAATSATDAAAILARLRS